MSTRKVKRLKKSRNKRSDKRSSKRSSNRNSKRNSKTFRNRNAKRRYKRGGAPEDKVFNNIQELQSYLNQNQWISRVYIYNKKQFDEGIIQSIYRFPKNEFSKMYEIGDVKNYLFQFM